jgi:hypothetical protein
MLYIEVRTEETLHCSVARGRQTQKKWMDQKNGLKFFLFIIIANMPVHCNGRKKIKYNSLSRIFCSLIFNRKVPVHCNGDNWRLETLWACLVGLRLVLKDFGSESCGAATSLASGAKSFYKIFGKNDFSSNFVVILSSLWERAERSHNFAILALTDSL